MAYYCHLDSAGCLSTNLQLYSLEQAADRWNELVGIIEERGVCRVGQKKERLVFILSCLGLSLSQLLGQNWPSPGKEKIDDPATLLATILRESRIDRTTCRRLNRGFADFLDYYNAVRHFGVNKKRAKYAKVNAITFQKLRAFKDLTIEIWDTVLTIFKADANSSLEDLEAISDAVSFNEIAEQGGGRSHSSLR